MVADGARLWLYWEVLGSHGKYSTYARIGHQINILGAPIWWLHQNQQRWRFENSAFRLAPQFMGFLVLVWDAINHSQQLQVTCSALLIIRWSWSLTSSRVQYDVKHCCWSHDDVSRSNHKLTEWHNTSHYSFKQFSVFKVCQQQAKQEAHHQVGLGKTRAA